MHSISLIVYRPPITEANSLPCAIAFRLSAKAASRLKCTENSCQFED